MTKNERGAARLAGAMRSCRLCALASLLAVAADGSPASAASTHPPLVRLSLVDLYGLAPDVAARAAAEAVAVLDRLGARTEARWKAPSVVHDPGELQVVVMPGDPGPLLKRTVMGAVLQDAATRALWVFPRTIAAALGLAPDLAPWTAGERARFATALGRVVAHEVVHLTCPWRDHDRTGLMAARMSRATLHGEALDLEDDLRRDFVLGAAAQLDSQDIPGTPPGRFDAGDSPWTARGRTAPDGRASRQRQQHDEGRTWNAPARGSDELPSAVRPGIRAGRRRRSRTTRASARPAARSALARGPLRPHAGRGRAGRLRGGGGDRSAGRTHGGPVEGARGPGRSPATCWSC